MPLDDPVSSEGGAKRFRKLSEWECQSYQLGIKPEWQCVTAARRHGSRTGLFPRDRPYLEIGAHFFAHCTSIEISRDFNCFVEVKHPLGLLQRYAVILHNGANGRARGAM